MRIIYLILKSKLFIFISNSDSNLSDFSNIINTKNIKINTLDIFKNQENNFIFKIFRKNEIKECNVNIPTKTNSLNKSFVYSDNDKKFKHDNDDRLDRLHDKVNSMIRSHDNFSNT